MMGFFTNLITATKSIALLLLLLASHGGVYSTSITTDKEALISFKSQLFSSQIPNPLSTWHENLSPCNWTGVSCDERRQRVVRLNLSGLRLTGSISPHIGNLSSLESLELQNNFLSGYLPPQLGKLLQLRSLNMSFNAIQGVVPSNISLCKALIELDLMQNQISGGIPPEIGRLPRLRLLNLARNQLVGNFPSFLTNVSSLVDLNLGTNRFVGPIPNEVSQLTNLKYLDLTINNLSGTVPPSIYNMSSLVYLALASNNLSGELPSNVGATLPNLLGFNFCFNKFTGTIPPSLHNLTNIKIIRMAHNLLHGSVPPGLENLPYLEMYNIGFNSIESEDGLGFLDLLRNSSRLNFLAIDGNLFNGTIPESIGNLSKVLTKFYMGGNDIYGSIPPSIGELKGLELFDAGDCSISGEIPLEIGKLTELRVLRLSNNMISGNIPNSLGNLKQLTKLDLSKNKLSGKIPTTFGNFQTLISMDLSDNNLNGTIPTELFNLPSLSLFLNLSQNLLTGPIPVEIESLENVAIINNSDNKLSGNIPNSIGNCKSLEQLLLARNTLSGSIPDTLANVRGLETLDLSSNRLSGVIPSNLQNLNSLELLNLSNNNLEGSIPTNGVFADPNKAYLQSNPHLCSRSSCVHPRGRKLTYVYIVVSIAAAASLAFVVGFIWYVRRGKMMMMKKGSFESFVKSQPPMISYNDLRLATDGFSEENVVGRGSFGVVYRGLLEGSSVAVKVLNAAVSVSRKSFIAECAALREVRHRNLVKLVTVCSSIDAKNEDFLAMVFEFMSNGSLDDWIRGRRRWDADNARFDVSTRLRCAIGIAAAVDYLHNETETPVVHCDLKPSNVLLDSDMTPKVADFGLAKMLLDSDGRISISSGHTLKGSIGYIPPEYGYGVKPSRAGDVYSYGILVLELFTGRSPTDEMFGGGVSLKSWVEQQFPTNVEQVVDVELVEEINKFCGESPCNSSRKKCEGGGDWLATIIGVGLSCTAESPECRIGIREALRKLKTVEEVLKKHQFVVGREHCSLQIID